MCWDHRYVRVAMGSPPVPAPAARRHRPPHRRQVRRAISTGSKIVLLPSATVVDDTHPTGMHSCFLNTFASIFTARQRSGDGNAFSPVCHPFCP